MGNGEWGMGNGEWGMGNGKWKRRNGEWGMRNGKLKWEIENGKLNIFYTLTFYNVKLIFSAAIIDTHVSFLKRSVQK